MVRFGPSGNDILFYKQGLKTTIQAQAWVAKLGLSAFEISFGRGIRMSAETAKKIGDEAAKHDIRISAHAPYFINLAKGWTDSETGAFAKSYGYIEKSLLLLKELGGRDLVVHIGSQGDLDRATAVENCRKNLKAVMDKLVTNPGLDFDFRICIETMGRYPAIGNYKEICDLCGVHERVIPTLDFGHINCLMQGGLVKDGAIAEVMDYCMQHAGKEKMQTVHIHFSPIKFGAKGELGHLNLEDSPKQFTPPFEPLAKYIKAKGLTPTIICESADCMAQDAVTLMKIFEKAR